VHGREEIRKRGHSTGTEQEFRVYLVKKRVGGDQMGHVAQIIELRAEWTRVA
jgi:hypothetical protein